MVNLNYVNLPESFFEEETRLDYTISEQMKEVWAIQLDMLQLVKLICEKYDIRWFVHGGTALGAVRDGHFIPWDDDIDIMMTRDNYDKFINAWKEENIADPYFLQCKETTTKCRHRLAKIRRLDTFMGEKFGFIRPDGDSGIFIDIFPLDKIPAGELEKEEFIETARTLVRNVNKYNEYCQHITSCNDSEDAVEYVDSAMLVKTNTDKFIYKIADFSGTVNKTFEGITVPVMSGYESFFKGKYGKKWETPIIAPANHTEQVYDTSNSYKVYVGMKSNNIVFMETQDLDIIKNVNALIQTGKKYVNTKYNMDMYPEIRTYDETYCWLMTLPDPYKRIIDLSYIGDDMYKYEIKLYSGKVIIESGDLQGTKYAQKSAVLDALRTILNPEIYIQDTEDQDSDSNLEFTPAES